MGELTTKMTALADEVRGLGGVSDTLGIAAMTDTVSAANAEILRQVELLEQIAAALESKINKPEEERLEGDGQEFYTMAPSTLSFRSTAPLNELQDVQVNGVTVDPSNYELEEGSTIVKLKHNYLSTLDKGKYELSVVSDSKTVKGDFTVAAPELNEYGFYYNQPYYAENIDVGDGVLNNVCATVAFMLLEDGTAQYIDFDAGNLTSTSFSYDNDVYTISLLGGDFTGTFSSDGKSFVTSKVFLPGDGDWIPDYNGTDQIEFKLDNNNIAADEEYFYLVNNAEALPINKFKKSYAMPRTNIGNKAITNFTNNAFSSNIELNSVNFIPEGFTTISHYMFNECTGLTSVTIPDSVSSIGHSAFDYCTNLTIVTIGNSVTSIGDSAFDYCYSLTSVTIPNSVTSIGKYAFHECTDLTSANIPDSVTYIGESAFSGCSSLTSITIPDSVTSIGEGAFSRCLRLPSITVKEKNPVYKSIDGILHSKDGKTLMQYPAGKTGTSFIIPDSVTSIGDQAFFECDSLTSVVIGDGVTSIGNNAFGWCYGLKSVTIGNSVTSIGSNVFNSCRNLMNITFEGTMDQWNAITKDRIWNLDSSITHIQCSDGQVVL